QAEDGIRDRNVTGVQTCALPIYKICGRERLRRTYDARRGWAASSRAAAALVRGKSSGGLGRPHWLAIRRHEGLLGVASRSAAGKIGRASCREGGESGGV